MPDIDTAAAEDARILRSASSDSDDWTDTEWDAWFRTAERVHGDGQDRTPLFNRVGALMARVAELEAALAATGQSLSTFIFDSDDPGSDALGAQWLFWQTMPQVGDPFSSPRTFRSSVFSEAANAAKELDTLGPELAGQPQTYCDGYSEGVQDVAERLEKLADQTSEGREPEVATNA